MALPPEMLMFESPTAMDLFGFCRNGNFGDTWGCYSRSPGGICGNIYERENERKMQQSGRG